MRARGIGTVLALACLLCFLVAPCAAQARENGNIHEIGARDAAKMLGENPDDILVLDVRTPGEFRNGHLPGAKNIDFFGGNFDVEAANLPHDKTTLVYCRSGKRSAGAVEELKRAGVKKILHLHEGMLAWEKAGLPVEKMPDEKQKQGKGK